MKKIKVFFQRVFSASFKRMFRNINLVHEESGKSRIYIFFDMIYSMFAYGTGYLDYMTFGFVNIKKGKRKTFLTMNDNLYLDKLLNDPQYKSIFRDKLIFNEHFEDFLHREYLNLEKATAEDFGEFCAGKTVFFAKQTESYGGLGVKKITLSEDTDLRELYNSLKTDHFILVEEAIRQHEELNRLCPSSINTLRITTLVNKEGKAACAYVLLRLGNGTNDVDNVSSGGMYALVGNDGIIHVPAFCDKTASYHEVHPVTQEKILGFEIPCYQQAVDLCLSAALRIPQMRYIGWDVAITPDGPCLVEGNLYPGYDMPQNHRFHPDGCGCRPVFEEILQESLH